MDKPHGALVTELFDEGPAKAAGFQLGDVIVKFNGKEIGLSSDLPPIVGNTPVGKTVVAEVLRDGNKIEIEVAVGELPAEDDLRTGSSSHSDDEYKKLGLTITEMTEAARKTSEIKEGGVLVKKVQDNAVDAGIKAGDVIVMLNRQQIDNAKSFAKIAAELEAGQRVPVLINRNGSPTFLAIKVAE
jgi:serine protease Do